MKYPDRHEYDFTQRRLASSAKYLTDTANITLWGVYEFFNAALPRWSEFKEAIAESKAESERKRLASLKFRIKDEED